MVLVFLVRIRVQKFSLAGTASWWSLLYLRVPQEEWIMWGSIEMCTTARGVSSEAESLCLWPLNERSSWWVLPRNYDGGTLCSRAC